jgi:uncharacterized membrane protein YdjX (TVP38/TMEM64 family)
MNKEKIVEFIKNQKNIKMIAAVLFIIAAIVLFRVFDLSARLTEMLIWIKELGWIDMAVYFFLYIAACVFVVPGSVLSLGAGLIYGVVQGSLIVSVSSTVGASAAFLLGRYLARGWVEKKIEDSPSFMEIDSSIKKKGWKIVMLLRLSPVFPFNTLNYVLGLTGVRFIDYVLASWIGMIPGTVMYVYIGSAAGSLAAISSGLERQRTLAEWIIYAIGLIAAVAVTVIITKTAKRALAIKIKE